MTGIIEKSAKKVSCNRVNWWIYHINRSANVSVCLSVSQSVSHFTSLSVCPSIRLSVSESVSQWIHQSISVSVRQSISPSVCQSVCQSGNGLLKMILCLKQLTQYHWYYRRNRHPALVQATVIQHPPFNVCESCFASGMEWDCPDPSRSIQHQEICKLQPRNFGWMNAPKVWRYFILVFILQWANGNVLHRDFKSWWRN